MYNKKQSYHVNKLIWWNYYLNIFLNKSNKSTDRPLLFTKKEWQTLLCITCAVASYYVWLCALYAFASEIYSGP